MRAEEWLRAMAARGYRAPATCSVSCRNADVDRLRPVMAGALAALRTPLRERNAADAALTLAWAGLRPRPGGDPWARALDPERFRAEQPLTGAAVLLLDDTWASGGSAQSAALALKRAGARAVAVVVIGRHVPAVDGLVTPARWADSCAVHAADVPTARAQVNRLDT